MVSTASTGAYATPRASSAASSSSVSIASPVTQTPPAQQQPPATQEQTPAEALETPPNQPSLCSNALAIQALQSIDEIQSKVTKKDQERAKWFPWLATVLALNIAVWLSTIFWVSDINSYYTNGKLYEMVGWLGIFLAVFATLLALVWCPKPKWFQQWREGLSKSTSKLGAPYLGNVTNATFCALVVIVYLRAVALPRYGRPLWESQVVYNETLIPPAFAFLGGGTYVDAAMAAFTGGGTVCTFPQYADNSSTDCPAAFSDEQSTLHIDSGIYGDLDAYISDPRELPAGKNSYTALSDRVLLRVNMNYNKTELRLSYSAAGMQTPFIHAILFDPRIDLVEALRCGLVSLTEIPALASNTFTLTAESTLDTLGVIQPSSAQPECRDFYTQTFGMKNPPYTSYSFNLGSMPLSNPNLCDSSANSDAICTSQALLRYGTRVVRMMESKRGMGKVDILVNEGAIVGAIQFFAWILGFLHLGA